jgi:hypothetical protein
MVECNLTETDTSTLKLALNIFQIIFTLFSVSTFSFFCNKNICINDLETLLHGNFDIFLIFFFSYTLQIAQTFLQQFCWRQTWSLLYRRNFFLRYLTTWNIYLFRMKRRSTNFFSFSILADCTHISNNLDDVVHFACRVIPRIMPFLPYGILLSVKGYYNLIFYFDNHNTFWIAFTHFHCNLLILFLRGKSKIQTSHCSDSRMLMLISMVLVHFWEFMFHCCKMWFQILRLIHQFKCVNLF